MLVVVSGDGGGRRGGDVPVSLAIPLFAPLFTLLLPLNYAFANSLSCARRSRSWCELLVLVLGPALHPPSALSTRQSSSSSCALSTVAVAVVVVVWVVGVGVGVVVGGGTVGTVREDVAWRWFGVRKPVPTATGMGFRRVCILVPIPVPVTKPAGIPGPLQITRPPEAPPNGCPENSGFEGSKIANLCPQIADFRPEKLDVCPE
jgi:hypothetical protein